MHCIDLKICSHMLSVRQGFGCVLAEYKRPALRERRETAKRFKAPNRPRKPGGPRPWSQDTPGPLPTMERK